MEFGHLPEKELDKIKFKLPADAKVNASIFATKKSQQQKVYVGCAKWGRKEWVGKIYPKGTKDKDFLEQYAHHYNSIELNAAFYNILKPDQIKGWVEKVGKKDFLFCPKAHRAMSFMKTSPIKKQVTENYISSIQHFGKMLGPVFLTMSGPYKQENEKDFFDYLAFLRSKTALFVEQRDPEFYASASIQNNYYEQLTKLGIGTIITDAAGRPDVLHARLTTPKAFVRFVGNSLHASDFPRIDNWAKKIKKWLDAGIEEIYFFMHMHDEGLSPELSRYTVEKLNKLCKLELTPVEFVK